MPRNPDGEWRLAALMYGAKSIAYTMKERADNERTCRCGAFCISSISSTPRNATAHAKQIRQVVDNCTGKEGQT